MKMFKRVLIAVLVVSFGLGITGNTKAATATVNLGTAAPFAILAGTPDISNVPTSAITGNVGLSPATGAGIGLTQAQVTGTIYSVDAAGPAGRVTDPALLTIAKNDLTAAYLDAAGRTPVTIVPTELGGTTKTAGVYATSSTALQITAGAGPLVLDGQGDPNAVFIFEGSDEIAGALTVGPGSVVSLINSASACNVFWRVYGASIDTTAVFKGNILALTSITVANGANVEGRLLARNGNVTLISDTISIPICTAAVATATSTATPTPTPTATSEADAAAAAAAAAQAAAAAAAKLPKTGATPPQNSILWNIIILTGVLVLVSTSLVVVLRKRKLKI